MTVSSTRQFQRAENFGIAVIQPFGHPFVHPVPEHMDATQGYVRMPVHVFPDGKDKRHAAPHYHLSCVIGVNT